MIGEALIPFPAGRCPIATCTLSIRYSDPRSGSVILVVAGGFRSLLALVSPPSVRFQLGLDLENSTFPLTPLRPASPVIDRAVGWIDTGLAVGAALPDVLVLVVLVLHG